MSTRPHQPIQPAPSENDAALQRFSEFLKKRGLHMTRQRRLILERFLAVRGHFSTEDVYGLVKRVDPGVGHATVFRTLKLLVEAGLARLVHMGDNITRYEPLPPGCPGQNGAHHEHLVCESCGAQVEIPARELTGVLSRLAKEHGFRLTGHELAVRGLCDACRAQPGTTDAKRS